MVDVSGKCEPGRVSNGSYDQITAKRKTFAKVYYIHIGTQ